MKTRRLVVLLFAMAAAAWLAFIAACNGGNASTCVPLFVPDASTCGSYGVDYDPTTSEGCVFDGGSGTAATCLALCGRQAACDLLTFTSVVCNAPCGD